MAVLRLLGVRRLSLLRARANSFPSSPETDLDSSIETMDRILSILQDAQANNTDSVIHADVTAIPRAKDMVELGHDIFNYKTIDELMLLQNQRNVDVFQDSHPDRVKEILETYIHIFKNRYMRKSGCHPSSIAESRAHIFSDIAEQFEQLPQRTYLKIGSFIRKEARDALRAVDAKGQSPLSKFSNVALYQPFRADTKDPLALRLGLSTKKHPSNILSVMINDHGILERFVKNTKSGSVNSLQNVMATQSIQGKLIFKILFQKHTSDPKLQLANIFDTVDSQKLKAIIASRSMILKRLDWFPPYRHSLQGLNDAILDDEEKVVAVMADLFDRFFGVCYKSDKKFCDEWVGNLIEFCAKNSRSSQFFQGLVLESISALQEKANFLSFDAMNEDWKEYGFLHRRQSHPRKSVKDNPAVEAELQSLRQLRELI